VDATVAPVLENDIVADSCRRLRIGWDGVGRGAKAGQFVMLRAKQGYEPFLPRPMSISDLSSDSSGRPVLEILYKIFGPGTAALATVRAGDPVGVFGPLGRGFDVRPDAPPATFVAGGIGNAPFPFLLRDMLSGPYRGRADRILFLLAARSKKDLYIQPWVRESGIEIVEVTEDGTAGEKGYATDALARRPDRFEGIVYACGPRPMLKALQRIADAGGFACQHAVEEVMACGFAVCNACVIRKRGVKELQYVKACVDGPVFNNDEIEIDA
jgi:dihydroorotate dehydrogenase electron transfer subunit